MGLPVPVPEGCRVQALRDQPIDVGGRLPAGVLALRREDESPGRAEAGDEALIGRDHREDLAERPVHRPVEEDLVDLGHARLHGHDAAIREPVPDQRVELLGEEQARRALFQRLDEVDHDQVKAIGGLLEVGARILVQEPGPRVVERALVHLGQVLLALVDHLAVDVDHQALGDAAVAEDLADGRALAAPDDHGALGTRMGEQARLDEQLMVDELVRLTRLDAAVEHQAFAVGERLHDLHELELGLPGRDRPGDGVHVPLDRRRGLEEPLVVRGCGHPSTATGLCRRESDAWSRTPRWSSTTEARAAPSCSTR